MQAFWEFASCEGRTPRAYRLLRNGHTQFGVVAKINKRTATIETSDGRGWRVDFELLRHVVEV